MPPEQAPQAVPAPIVSRCPVQGCDRPPKIRGFCKKHYESFQRGLIDPQGNRILQRCKSCKREFRGRRNMAFCPTCYPAELRRREEERTAERRSDRAVRERIEYLATQQFLNMTELRCHQGDLKPSGKCRICGLVGNRVNRTHLKSHERLWQDHRAGLVPSAFPLGWPEEWHTTEMRVYNQLFGFNKQTAQISDEFRKALHDNFAPRASDVSKKGLAARGPGAIEKAHAANKGRHRSEEAKQRQSEKITGKAVPSRQKHSDGEIVRLFLLEGKSAEESGEILEYSVQQPKEGYGGPVCGGIRNRLEDIFGISALSSCSQLVHGEPGSGKWLSEFRKRFGNPSGRHLAKLLGVPYHDLRYRKSDRALSSEWAEKAAQWENRLIQLLMEDQGKVVAHLKAVLPSIRQTLRAVTRGMRLLGLPEHEQMEELNALCAESRDEVNQRREGLDARTALCLLATLHPWLAANPRPEDRQKDEHAEDFVAFAYGLDKSLIHSARYGDFQPTPSGEVGAVLRAAARRAARAAHRPKGAQGVDTPRRIVLAAALLYLEPDCSQPHMVPHLYPGQHDKEAGRKAVSRLLRRNADAVEREKASMTAERARQEIQEGL